MKWNLPSSGFDKSLLNVLVTSGKDETSYRREVAEIIQHSEYKQTSDAFCKYYKSLHSAHSCLWHQVGTGSLSASSIRLYLGFLSTGWSTIIASQRCKRSRFLNWWILRHVNPWIVNVELSMGHLVWSNTICSSNGATKLASLTITPRDARDTGRINVEVSGVWNNVSVQRVKMSILVWDVFRCLP